MMPPVLVAGDSLLYVRDLPNYKPSDGWLLKVALVKPDTPSILLDVALNGDDRYRVSAASSDTAGWAAGVYTWQEIVEKPGGERHTVAIGALQVDAALDDQANGYDTRTVWQQTLDNLESAYRNMAAGNIKAASVTFNGYVTQYRTLEELIKAIDHARRQVARERQEKALRDGLPAGNRIQYRF